MSVYVPDRLSLVPSCESPSNCEPPSRQRKIDGLPAAQKRLQNGHPVCMLTEYAIHNDLLMHVFLFKLQL